MVHKPSEGQGTPDEVHLLAESKAFNRLGPDALERFLRESRIFQEPDGETEVDDRISRSAVRVADLRMDRRAATQLGLERHLITE